MIKGAGLTDTIRPSKDRDQPGTRQFRKGRSWSGIVHAGPARRFRIPHHCGGEFVMRTSEPKAPPENKDWVVCFRFRKTRSPQNDANFGNRDLAPHRHRPAPSTLRSSPALLLPANPRGAAILARPLLTTRCRYHGRKGVRSIAQLRRHMQYPRQPLGRTWLIEPFAVRTGLADRKPPLQPSVYQCQIGDTGRQ
jgi:hypothetical protein